MAENWLDIPEWPHYRISTLGRVYRKAGTPYCKNGRFINPTRLSNGYLVVRLSMSEHRQLVLLHSLVLKTFKGPRPTPIHQAAHRDGNKENCRLYNLRWATPLENASDKIPHGTILCGERHPSAKVSDRKIATAFQMRKNGAGLKDISEMLGCSISNTSMILRKIRRKTPNIAA